MEITMYAKKCRICGKDFESSSRNTRYCSEECYTKACKKNKAKRRKAKLRKEAYDSTLQFQRLLSRAYTLSHAIADQCGVRKECGLKLIDPNHVCSGGLELHHIDSNPLNMSPDNMEWLCRGAHEHYQKQLPELSMANILKECAETDDGSKHFEGYLHSGREIGRTAWEELHG